ncbi:GGDEF domain-containing protein [Arthrobacter sp. LAR12-1-1.1]|uniref:GGDEF domain-containing protein n=1 Tax=Arthrobacter sp. LAR12-1-1.1 TaxID=3135215 RepID=UPI00343BECCC
MLAVGLLGVVLTSGCALGSNAPGRAAGAVKDGARRETIGNVASENFTRQLYGSSAVGAATLTGAAGVDPAGLVLADVEDAEADRAKLLQEARHRALHDPLTGLPNRRHLEESLLAALARAGEQRNRVGVLFCDVNNFKRVNDTLGHAAGDQVLEHVALMLSGAVRGADTVTRYSGDEFVVLIPWLEHPGELEAVAGRVQSCLAGAVTIAGSELRLGMSVGQAETAVRADAAAAEHKELATALLLAADQDMYRIKTEMRGAVTAS